MEYIDVVEDWDMGGLSLRLRTRAVLLEFDYELYIS